MAPALQSCSGTSPYSSPSQPGSFVSLAPRCARSRRYSGLEEGVSCVAPSATRPHHADGPLRPSPVHRLLRRAGRLCARLRGEADHVSRGDRGVRSCHRRRPALRPRPYRPRARPAGARRRRGGARIDGNGNRPRPRPPRPRSQPHRVLRLARRRRHRGRPDRTPHPPRCLAARRRSARHHRVHQRPDRQFRPRRTEAHAAGPAGPACPALRRRLVVHRASRHGAVGERPARRRPPEDRPLPRAEPHQPLGGARHRASRLRARRCRARPAPSWRRG